MPLVGVVMGSASDEPLVQGDSQYPGANENRLRSPRPVGAPHPGAAAGVRRGGPRRGIEVLIAAACGSAALAGALASWTTLPVIGVPLATSELKGMDALLSTVQMPPGIPVAAVAVGAWGARNLGLPGRGDPGSQI